MSAQLQRAIIIPRYMIPEIDGAGPAVPGLEVIHLPMPFGRVDAWYLPPVESRNQSPNAVVVFAHGNAERIDFCLQELMSFTRWGIGVLLVEFPGYGQSKGKPSQKTITQTFTLAYDTITKRPDVDPNRIILYGRSIGGGAVCALSKERPAAALILTSTFTSVRSFAKRYLVPPFLVRDPFDNLSAVRDYRGPVLIFHGKHDDVIPFSHGQALYRNSRNARFITYNCGHNDCPPDTVHFWHEIETFLESSGLKD